MTRLAAQLAGTFRVADTAEGDRVTTLELFFDLVYAFAFTQVTALMAHGDAPGSVLDGLIVLSLLWFSWCSFSWLANQARADRGVLRLAFVVAMAAVFIACLALPDVFHPVPDGLNAAAVVVTCYGVVRVTHAAVYVYAAGDDARLRAQVVLTVLASLLPTLGLLVAGAVVGHGAQRWIWLAAVGYDFASIFVTAKINRGWVIKSAAHFAERHALIVMLALGESIIAIATGLGDADLDAQIATAAVLSILIAVGLYFAYFARVVDRLDTAVHAEHGWRRANLGRDVFTYLHFPIIAGVIITALGIEQVMAHLDDDHLGGLGGWALGGGTALFLVASAATVARCERRWPLVRIGVGAVLLGGSALLTQLPPLLVVGVVALVVLAVAALDSSVRDADGPVITAH